MAESDFSTAKFIGVCNNDYYFEDGCIEEDLFQDSETSVKLLGFNNGQFLILNDDGWFEKKTLTMERQSYSENKFHLRFLNNTNPNSNSHRAVILYAVKSGKNLVVCCNGSGGIEAKEMEIHNIKDSSHMAVFYMTETTDQSNKYMFKSSLSSDKYLGFDPDESNPPVVKLLLRMYNPNNQNDELSAV